MNPSTHHGDLLDNYTQIVITKMMTMFTAMTHLHAYKTLLRLPQAINIGLQHVRYSIKHNTIHHDGDEC